MRSEVARVAGVASDEPSFRAFDLNLALSPTREAVCTPSDLEACFVDDAEYRGQAFVGIDIGEASSGTRRSPSGLRAALCGPGCRLVTDARSRGTVPGVMVPTTPQWSVCGELPDAGYPRDDWCRSQSLCHRLKRT